MVHPRQEEYHGRVDLQPLVTFLITERHNLAATNSGNRGPGLGGNKVATCNVLEDRRVARDSFQAANTKVSVEVDSGSRSSQPRR